MKAPASSLPRRRDVGHQEADIGELRPAMSGGRRASLLSHVYWKTTTFQKNLAHVCVESLFWTHFCCPILKVDSTSRLKRSLFGQTFSRRLLSHVSAKTQNRLSLLHTFKDKCQFRPRGVAKIASQNSPGFIGTFFCNASKRILLFSSF